MSLDTRSYIALLALTLSLAGCATIEAKPRSLPASSEHAIPMIAVEAHRDATRFFIRYRHGERIVFAGGRWGDLAAVSPHTEVGEYSTPVLAPIETLSATRWHNLPESTVELPVLGVERWRRLRDRLLHATVPASGAGIAVDFGHAEYFLYYDADGVFQVTRLLDKPADYPVRGILRFGEFMHGNRPILDAFFAEEGIRHREFLFNTGDVGPYSLPFIYLNIDTERVAFVRNVPERSGNPVSPLGLKGGQALSHVVHSHLGNLVTRPVSSLYRLFFLLTDTTATTLRFDWTTGLQDKPVPPLSTAPPMDLARWERNLDAISSRPATRGTVDVHVDGEAYFIRLIDVVSSASESVDLQTYIFDNDDYAVKIAELLKRRSNEGLEIRILLDGFGTIAGTMADPASLPARHEPPASVRRFLQRDSRIQVRQKANPWFTGDHIKATIVDRETAFIGGMNIGREYRYDWHDLMLELRGPVVDAIQREFHVAWSHAGPLGDLGFLAGKATAPRDRSEDEGHDLRLLLTAPGNYEIYRAQLEAIRRAQSYIYVQNAYLTDDQLLRELVLARRRGVDVRVIVPLDTDHGPITRSNVLAMNLMLEHGIRVFIYPGFSHVKAAIYDGWVCVGSANFDRLSFRLNRELNLASSEPAVAELLLTRLFERDFAVSPELTEPVPAQWLDYLVEIVGDYLY